LSHRPEWPRCTGPRCTGPLEPDGPPHFSVVVNVRTLSETNRRDRWGLIERKAAQKKETFESVAVDLGKGQKLPPRGPWFVRFTRVSSNHLDPGNLPAALKAVEDQVAACLGVDDGSPLYEPSYRQEARGRRGAERVRVEVWGTP
jgi:hypothetical protein